MVNKVKLIFSFVLLFAFCSTTVLGQDSTAIETSNKLPFIGISFGLLNYHGELASVDNIGKFHNPGLAVQLNLNCVFKSVLGVELHTLYAAPSHEQRSLDVLHNFKTTVVGGGVNLLFYFDNGFMLKKDRKLSPFVLAGVTPFAYFPYGDFQDSNGNIYHYWTDGSIMSEPERGLNAGNAIELTKDFDYELSYRGKTGAPTFALAFNLGAGANFRVNKWLQAQLRLVYSPTSTDFVDGVSSDSKKDGFLVGSFGFNINPNLISKKADDSENEEGEDIDVDEFLALDGDGDGVPDLMDKCSGTIAGSKVNKQGCAIEVKPSEIDSMAMISDSLIVVRKTLCEKYPMLCGENDSQYPEVNEASRRKKKKTKVKKDHISDSDIQRIVDIADLNKDGKVELPELYKAIEQFFDKGDELSLPQLRQLIDHFFDQY